MSEPHDTWLRIAAKWRRERQEAIEVGTAFTPDPEPPGEDWKTALGDPSAFAAAGLCELWRMDLGEETTFGHLADFPPEFNLSGLWFRKA